MSWFKISTFPHICLIFIFFSFSLFLFADLRQELAVRERQADVTRMSAPSSPTQDSVKMDTAVQASLSLPATPLSKGLDNAFANQTGFFFFFFFFHRYRSVGGEIWAALNYADSISRVVTSTCQHCGSFIQYCMRKKEPSSKKCAFIQKIQFKE